MEAGQNGIGLEIPAWVSEPSLSFFLVQRKALQEALKLLKHYAGLLNQYDGGLRQVSVFETPETWIARLRELNVLPTKE